jgi:multimeric flavodoxin WrbA
LIVLGISGTPRLNGNSEHLLSYATQPFMEKGWELKILKLSELNVKPCTACDACLKTGICGIDDDMPEFYQAFALCQAILISTPVYYRNITSRLMAVFERHYACRQSQPLKGKPGGAMAVGRSSGGGGQAIALTIVHNWLLSCGAICVPGELNGVTASADRPGDILSQTNRLWQARTLGENVMHLAEKLYMASGEQK